MRLKTWPDTLRLHILPEMSTLVRTQINSVGNQINIGTKTELSMLFIRPNAWTWIDTTTMKMFVYILSTSCIDVGFHATCKAHSVFALTPNTELLYVSVSSQY